MGVNTKAQPRDLGLAFLICCFIIFVIYFLESKFQLFSMKTQKSNLWKVYGVNNDTFSKWIKCFCADANLQSTYLRKRKLDFLEILYIVSILGLPEELALLLNVEPTPCLRKSDIIARGEGSYRSLRESIRQYPDTFCITPEAFAHLSKFPPSISRIILEAYS